MAGGGGIIRVYEGTDNQWWGERHSCELPNVSVLSKTQWRPDNLLISSDRLINACKMRFNARLFKRGKRERWVKVSRNSVAGLFRKRGGRTPRRHCGSNPPPPSKTSPSPNRKPAKTWVRPMRPRRKQFARDDIHEVWSLRALERIRLPPEDLHVSQLSGERIWGR